MDIKTKRSGYEFIETLNLENSSDLGKLFVNSVKEYL